jgi:hypothetical protein
VWIGGAEGLHQYAPPDDWYHADLGISTFSRGILEVDINYTGYWYRETFDYTRQAESIKHFVLVMPEKTYLTNRFPAHNVFHSIRFQTRPDDPLVQEGKEEFAWAFDHLYEAPEGRFREEFVPGRYYLAAAFIAAFVSSDEASGSDDAIRDPGIIGGGASTDYQEIMIEPGQTHSITLNITDADGWACPWIYVFDGRRFVRMTEILRNLRGKQSERTEVSRIGPVRTVNDTIILRVAEEREETAFIDQLFLVVDGVKVVAESDPQIAAKVAELDRDYLIITSGESYAFRFRLSGSIVGGDLADVRVVASGFYMPVE